MKNEISNLKIGFVIQSFAPLFLLLTIKYLDFGFYWVLAKGLSVAAITNETRVLKAAINQASFGRFIISAIGILWLLTSIFIACGFKGAQASGFREAGERIKIKEAANDNSATFLVTYVLPLLTDNVESCRELLVFLMMLMMVIILLSRSNTFYQNPVLAAMKYRTFSFRFVNPDVDITCPDKIYVGITKGKSFDENAVIKRKYISDGVFVVYNV